MKYLMADVTQNKPLIILQIVYKTKPLPFCEDANGNLKSYTLSRHFNYGLDQYITNTGYGELLSIKSLNFSRSWKSKIQTIRENIKVGNPLVALIRAIPSCVNAKPKPKKFATNIT